MLVGVAIQTRRLDMSVAYSTTPRAGNGLELGWVDGHRVNITGVVDMHLDSSVSLLFSAVMLGVNRYILT